MTSIVYTPYNLKTTILGSAACNSVATVKLIVLFSSLTKT